MIPPRQYIALLEKNIEFAKRHNFKYPNNPMYPKLPEEYENIAIENQYGGFDIFGNYFSESQFEIIRLCDAVIDKCNNVIKNRYGDQCTN